MTKLIDISAAPDEWISVANFLPRDRKVVWVYNPSEDLSIRVYPCRYDPMLGWGIRGATYWRPLLPPEPPSLGVIIHEHDNVDPAQREILKKMGISL